MLRRLPWTVWLHLSWDLWRLVLLTAAILVTVISFAAAVKFMADGKLGPVETLQFMFLSMLPMLQYALPFAACFGATLAYHRWAADNELTACHAGGISHRALIVPALAAAVVLSLAVLVLSDMVIPRFFRSMAELVSQDASKLIVHTIERGDAVSFGDRMIYADQVVPQGADAGAGAFERLWLGGVLIVKLDSQGGVEEQASASEASVWLRRIVGSPGDETGAHSAPMTEVVIRPREAVFERRGVRGEVGDSIKPLLIPNTFAENPKFLSSSELSSLRDQPERIDNVERPRRELALWMAQGECVEQLRRSLREQGFAELVDEEGQRVVVRAADLRPTRRRTADKPRAAPDHTVQQLIPPKGGKIVVEQTLSGGRIRRQDAGAGAIRLPKSNLGAAPPPGIPTIGSPDAAARARIAFTLDLLKVSARELDENGELIALNLADGAEPGSPAFDAEAAIGAMSEWTIKGVTLASDPSRKFLGTSTFALMDDARARMDGRPADRETLAGPLATLKHRVDDILREAFSKRQERVGMAAACLVMVLIGGVMAMRLKDSLPLTIYLWAFFPALAAVISINAGQQLTHEYGLPGLLLLWGGVAALGAYGVSEFVRLVRH